MNITEIILMIFPFFFVDSMEHQPIYLAYEKKVRDPMQYK
jgi:hypothetical protein